MLSNTDFTVIVAVAPLVAVGNTFTLPAPSTVATAVFDEVYLTALDANAVATTDACKLIEPPGVNVTAVGETATDVIDCVPALKISAFANGETPNVFQL